MPGGKRYAVVVYGATGVTGRQVAHHLARRVEESGGLPWAIAGRSADRLHALRRLLPSPAGVVVADVASRAEVERMVASTRVVLNMAGPYARCSEPLVRACARLGVDYLDVTGETAHVRRLIDRYHDEAEHTGAKIVPFCGFDSVPSDLGTLLLVKHFRRRGLATREVKGFFRAFGSLNGGTIATTAELWRNPADVRAMADPLLLNPSGRSTPGERARDADPVLPVLDPDLGRWVAPFFMGPINTRVVRRSRALSAQWRADYGPDFRYQEYWDPGGPADLVAAGGIAWSMVLYRLMSRTPGASGLLAPFVAPGPAAPVGTSTEHDFFRALFVGTAADGSRAWSELAGRGDPSNGATARIVCECALALALDRSRLPGGSARGGVLTPAAALGLPLARRLRAAGIRVRCRALPS